MLNVQPENVQEDAENIQENVEEPLITINSITTPSEHGSVGPDRFGVALMFLYFVAFALIIGLYVYVFTRT